MASASAGTVNVDFTATTLRFVQQLKEVNSSVKGVETGLGKLKDVAQTALGVLGVGALGAFIKSAANAADELGKTADKVGLTTKQLKAFQIAAAEAGVGLEQANKLLTESQKRLGEAAAGTGEAAKYIKLLGLNVEELQKLSPDQLFRTYSEAINGLANRSEQLAAANALMGRSAQESFALIQGGAPALDEAAEFTERLGLALDRVDIKQIEAANDSFGRLAIITQSAAQQFSSGLAPFVEDFSLGVVQATGNLNALSDAGRITGATLVTAFEISLNAMRSLQSAFFGLAGFVNKTWADLNEIIIRGSAILANPSFLFNPALRDQLDRAVEASTGSIRASAEANFQAAEESLGKIKSIAQIQEGIVNALESSRARAEAAVAAQAAQVEAAKAGGLTLGDGSIGLDQQQQFDIANEAAKAAAEQQKAIFREVTQAFTAELDRRNEAERDAAAARVDLNLRAEQAILDTKVTTQNAALGLLQALGAKNKAFAIAAIVFEKALAIQRLLMQNTIAAELAYASQLIPGVPASIATATAAKASVLAQGRLAAGLIAATGALQIADVTSGGGRAPIGSALNPGYVTTSPDVAQQYGAESQSAIQVIVTGNFGVDDRVIDKIAAGLREAADGRDVIIFGPGSRQAQEILGG